MEIITLFVACIICKSVIFNKHKEKWWKAIIPGYNYYILGKLGNSPKLGKVNMFLIPLSKIYFYFCYYFQLWIIKNYAVQAKVPYNNAMQMKIEVILPEKLAKFVIAKDYALIVVVTITLIIWSKMMFTYTKTHEKSGWWVILWAFIPLIPFIYFAISKTVYVDGKIYHIKVKKEITYEQNREKRIRTTRNARLRGGKKHILPLSKGNPAHK